MTAPGLGPARAAVQCLLPGIKIANMLLVSHRSPVCMCEAGHYSNALGCSPTGGLGAGQALAKGTMVALSSRRTQSGKQLDGHLQSSAVQLVVQSV